MAFIVSDANIFIDMLEGEILNELFLLPYQLIVPDILYYEELKLLHSDLLSLGLCLGELHSETMMEAEHIMAKYPQPSRNDCFALLLAKQEDCCLITGDKALRKAAESEQIQVFGTLWIVEQLVSSRNLTKEQAVSAYHLMRNQKRRLPWKTALYRLDHQNLTE